MKNTEQYLKDMGFHRIGRFYIEKKKFIVDCEEEYLSLEKMIYIHVVDNEILRVGTSKNKLMYRMRSWERDVTKSINQEKSSTPLWEGELWNEILKNKIGTLYGRQGSDIKTPVGKINIYLSEESYLIGKHQPKMNRDKSRHKL